MNAYEYNNPPHDHPNSMHQMLSKSSRTQSKTSNPNPNPLDIFDPYENSTQLRTSSNINRSSTYYSKSEFDGFNGPTKKGQNQSSHQDPNGTYSKVLESTNFTVSEGNTKDSGTQGDILERVVMDLLANCDEELVLEKNLWQIENYILSLKYEQNHLERGDCGSSRRSESAE